MTGNYSTSCFQKRKGILCDYLIQEYKRILDGDGSAANKFWKLEKRIKADRKSPGVIVEASRRSMFQILLQLISEKVITDEDLNGFSEELRDMINDVVK